MRVTRSDAAWAVIYPVTVLLLVLAFLYSVRAVLSPFILLPAVLLLLWPFSGTRTHLFTVIVLTLLGVLWLLETTGFLLAPFLLALVLAYILNPAVTLLERRRVPRGVAILLLALPVIALLAAAIGYGVPALAQQLESLIGQLPRALERAAVWIDQARFRVLNIDLPLVHEAAIYDWLSEYDADRVEAFLRSRQREIAERAWGAVLGLGRGIGAALTILGYIVLTPVLTYYLLRDWGGMKERLRRLFPRGREEVWTSFLGEYDRLLSHFLRGQLFAAAIVGVLTWLGLWILGFPYSGVVGAVAGVFNLVPYLGLIVSLVPALIITFLSGSILASLAKVAAVFIVVQFLDGSVIGPRIVGESVGLHPVWVMLALAVGGFFFGFVGLLLAIPGAVLIKLLLREALLRYERSRLYTGAAAGPAAD